MYRGQAASRQQAAAVVSIHQSAVGGHAFVVVAQLGIAPSSRTQLRFDTLNSFYTDNDNKLAMFLATSYLAVSILGWQYCSKRRASRKSPSSHHHKHQPP